MSSTRDTETEYSGEIGVGGGVGDESLEHQAGAGGAAASPLYETKALMCKNNCGYFGNPIQYEGYCSICYRKLKQSHQQNHPQQQQQVQNQSSQKNFTPAASFDDASSLLTSSVSFNNGFYAEDSKKYCEIIIFFLTCWIYTRKTRKNFILVYK